MEIAVTKIFIAGSISIQMLDESVTKRINKMIDQGYEIILGDADGIDKAVQEYLNSKNYDKVTVYHSGKKPRNNLGNWHTNSVITEYKFGTRAFFTAKDLVLANDADIGVMLWDKQSTGTLKNIIELINQRKKVTVFLQQERKFQRVYNTDELLLITQKMSESSLKNANKKIKIFERIESLKREQLQPSFL
ncbi:hypothetical protein [Acinetobacter lwoffii]|uniref:hypothetical protein n=1 Tax=Acinetobacter lwoffii TaxID=28090 RepID=UPI001FB4D0E0|nr:hypothetical protein [Acinetobacter lwoffii]MCJ0929334.1 hypothetical protein [Acinetobacter lwoffii]